MAELLATSISVPTNYGGYVAAGYLLALTGLGGYVASLVYRARRAKARARAIAAHRPG